MRRSFLSSLWKPCTQLIFTSRSSSDTRLMYIRPRMRYKLFVFRMRSKHDLHPFLNSDHLQPRVVSHRVGRHFTRARLHQIISSIQVQTKITSRGNHLLMNFRNRAVINGRCKCRCNSMYAVRPCTSCTFLTSTSVSDLRLVHNKTSHMAGPARDSSKLQCL